MKLTHVEKMLNSICRAGQKNQEAEEQEAAAFYRAKLEELQKEYRRTHKAA